MNPFQTNKAIEELHYLRLRIGNIKQVLEVLSLRLESQPIPFYSPLSESPDCEPVALFPMMIKPTEMNNVVVQLNDEYFIQMSAKEAERHLTQKIKELEEKEKRNGREIKESIRRSTK